MSKINTLITYNDLLDKINNSENHLLLGNGFNNSLGVSTNYKDIFSLMKEQYSEYEDVENIFKQESFDIEKLIGNLKGKVKNDNKFLSNYIEKKVKLDFMNATNKIVQKRIKNETI